MTPSKAVGASGIAAILGALGYIFTLLSNADYLLAFLVAIQTHQDPDNTIVKLIAAVFGLVGAVVVTCVGFWLANSPLATFTITETRTTEMKGTPAAPAAIQPPINAAQPQEKGPTTP